MAGAFALTSSACAILDLIGDSAQDYAAFEFLNAKVAAQAAAWKEVVSKDLADLNEKIRKENIPVISPAAGKEAASGPAR